LPICDEAFRGGPAHSPYQNNSCLWQKAVQLSQYHIHTGNILREADNFLSTNGLLYAGLHCSLPFCSQKYPAGSSKARFLSHTSQDICLARIFLSCNSSENPCSFSMIPKNSLCFLLL